jgi:Family of unknown function (DUF6152)
MHKPEALVQVPSVRGGITMRVKLPGVLAAVFALFGAAIPAFAHHGFSVEFDGSKCMNLKGTLTSIDWENPHAYVHLDVKDADGKTVSWRLEMITPLALKRNGTTRQDFLDNMGKPMAARACPTKAGGTPNRGAAEFIELADNQVRVTGQLVEKIPPDQFHF